MRLITNDQIGLIKTQNSIRKPDIAKEHMCLLLHGRDYSFHKENVVTIKAQRHLKEI